MQKELNTQTDTPINDNKLLSADIVAIDILNGAMDSDYDWFTIVCDDSLDE